MVAALLNLHESPLPSLKTGNHEIIIFVIAENVADNRFFNNFTANIFFQLRLFPVAEHQVHFRHAGKRFRIDLRGTAGNHYFGVRIFPPQLAHRLSALTFGLTGYRTGVDNYQPFCPGKFFL